MRVLGLALITALLLAVSAFADWIPPGLSQQERVEWKNGRPPGWSEGEKRGWRGKSCPPGQAKKGRCPDNVVYTQVAVVDPIQAAIQRLREWARQHKLPAPMLDATLIGFQGAVHHGVPIPVAERFVMGAAEHAYPPLAIEKLTRALAYGVRRGVAPDELYQFAEHGWKRGVLADPLALGLYRMGAEGRR
jgi:hypothetical protein